MTNPPSDHHLADGFHGGRLAYTPSKQLFRFGAAERRVAQPIYLSDRFPNATDQGQTGSCGAHTITKLRHALVNNWRLSTGQPLLDPDAETFSELWAYYWARRAMGTFPQDSGVDNASLCQAMVAHGGVLASELPWDPETAPQDITRDLSGLQPPSDQFYGISGWAAVGGPGMDPVASIQAALSAGYGVGFGFSVYDNFFLLDGSGLAPLPKRGSRFRGGHDLPIADSEPSASDPGGGRFWADLSWSNFGVARDGKPGRWVALSYGFITQMFRDRNMPGDAFMVA